ncbi:uncharacterized protein ACNS7B_007199 [Menidia menidia]
MGNRFSRRRDPPASGSEAVATEQKPEVEPAAVKPVSQNQVSEPDNAEVLAEKPAAAAACPPKEESQTESKEEETPAPSGPIQEPEPTPKEPPAPAQPELLLSAGNPPEPADAAPLAPEPAPEPVRQPDSPSYPGADPDPVPEAEILVQHGDLLERESLPEPEPPSPPLIELSAPEAPPSPDPGPDPLTSDQPPHASAGERFEVSEGSTLGQEESTETLEFLEDQSEAVAAEGYERFGSDVNEGSVSEILTNSELEGNYLLNDLIPSDVKVPDDSPIMDVSTSIELM